MTTPPDGSSRGIHISGGIFTGNARTGDNSRAQYVHHAAPDSGTADSPEAARLRQAVEELRAQLRTAAAELTPPAANAATAGLDELEDALPGPGEPEQGRIQRAIFTITGALASAASLTEAVRALRDAAAPWF